MDILNFILILFLPQLIGGIIGYFATSLYFLKSQEYHMTTAGIIFISTYVILFLITLYCIWVLQ